MKLLNNFFKARKYPIGTIRTQGGIKKKKVGEGKWIPVKKLRTSNKRESNQKLSPEEDYKQNGVRSKAFKAWFGDWENDPKNASKVVDKKTGKPKETYNTAPIKVYHGTSFGGFKSFKKEYAAPGLFGRGFYFTEDKSIAKQYADPKSRVERVYTHYFDLDDSEEKKKVLKIFKKYKKINQKEADKAHEFYIKNKKSKDSRTRSAAQRAYRIYLTANKRVKNLDYYLTHSRDNAAINKFIDDSKYRNSSYLTTDWRVYEDIKKTVKQLKPKVYELYLNIRKPLDLDSKIPFDLKRTIIKDKDMVRYIQQGIKGLESRAKIAGMQLNKKNLRLMLKEAKTYREYMAVFAKITEEEDDMEGPTRLRFIELIKKHTGCDGFTHIGGGLVDKKGKKHKVWIAFKPTQMKAVDNVGTFNPKTTNIFKAQTPEHTLLKHKNNWYVVADSKWQLFYWFPKNLEKAYKLQGRTTFQDLPISIENRKGSVRHWYDPMKDEHGETKMKYPYGYIRLTEGADGEHVDVYIGDNKNSRRVFVVRQQNPKTGEYDEDKVMLGFNNPKEAKEAYLMHYNDPRFFGSMDEYDMDTFKDHIKRKKGKISVSGRLNKAYYSAEDLKNKNMRWVTIRGNHVLVQGLADGGYVVVGGAGGALNHLRLDKLLSKEEYAKKEKERKERAKKIFNELTPEEKREQLEQRKKIVEAKRKLRSSYAEKVASILGTSISDLKSKISLQDMDEIERRARKEIEAKKKRKISEADKEDIEKQKAKEIEKEIKKKIKTAEQSAVDVLAKDFLGDDLDPNGKISAKKLLDTKKAMEILKAKKEFNKQLKQLGKERAEYSTRLKEGDVFAGNSKSLDFDILKQVREDIETQKNVKMYDKLNAQALSIQKHIDTGAVNALNGILSEVYGTGALFNSDVVQNLGIEALARTISVKLQLDGRGEVVRKALIDYAKQYREKVVDQATKEFDSRMEKADVLRSLAVDSEDGAALLSKASANGHALKQIVQGQKALGMAVGSLRGVAHLINALEESPQDRVVIDAGKNLLEARQKARAAGLPRSSYSIKTYQRGKGKRLVIEIPRSTITSFFTNNQANRRQEKLNDLIKAHKENTGYKPPGIKQSIKLDPAQEAGLRFFKNNKRVLLDFEAGLGKTSLAYAGAMEAIHNSGAKKVLIVTPAKLRTQMYSERKVFLDDENQKLVHPPTTDKTKRIANYSKDGIMIIGHDQLRTDADIIKNANYDMIVVDEIHEMTSKGSESGRYKGMMKLKDIPMKIGMSGTNIKNDKSEVYKKINFIDPDHTLGSLADFNKRYKGLNQSTGIFSDSSNDAFRKDISKWVYTQKNHLPVHNDIEMLRVNLSKRQREMYAQSENIYRKEKASKRVGASARRDARNYKIIQNTDSQDNAKISKIVDIMRNKHPEEKAVIHVTGLSAMQTAKKRLEQEFGKGCVGLIYGSSRANEVKKVKQAFNDPGNPLRFIIGTKSLEAGHNLQGGGTVTFQLDLPDTYASFDQRNKRIYRKGQNRDVKTYVLSGHNPYDMRREDILDTKKREMGLMGNPREIESMDESGFLALMRKYETGESDAIKESAKTA